MVLLDNMSLPDLKESVRINAGRAVLEISGRRHAGRPAHPGRNRRGPHLHRHADQGRAGDRFFDAL
jgi:hypothetical protein